MEKFTAFPWGRTACVLGSVIALAYTDEEPMAGVVLALGFIFAAVALQAISVWRGKA